MQPALILRKLDVSRLPASQRYKRKQTPLKAPREAAPRPPAAGRREIHRTAQSDRRKKRYYPLHRDRRPHAPPDPARLPARAIRRPRSRSSTTPESTLPFQVDQVQTDNGQELGTTFHWHLRDKGIGHVKIRPRTPQPNGKVERSHRIDSDEFYRLLEGEVIDDANLFAERLQRWEDHYNYDRPHGALAGQTPYERLQQKTRDPLS